MIVDVVIPCYNGEKYLRRAIDSVVNQTFKVNKIIVVNDGSSDKSEDLLRDLSVMYLNLHIISQPNQGLSSARNTGICASQADLIALLDVDDYWKPDKLHYQVDYLRNNPRKLAVFSSFLENRNGEIKDGKDAPQSVITTPRSILLQLTFFPGSGSSILFRSSLLKEFKNQLFDQNLSFAEDLDCWIKILSLGEVGVIKSRDVVIDVRSDSLQRLSQKNPMPYLQNLLLILLSHRELISRFEFFFHRYFIVYQAFKLNFSIKIANSELAQISKYFPLLGRIPSALVLRFVSLLMMPVYWMYRKVFANK